MNILLIGSGGREHALAWAISASPLLTKLYCAPGNAGIAQVAECVPIDAMAFDRARRVRQGEANRFRGHRPGSAAGRRASRTGSKRRASRRSDHRRPARSSKASKGFVKDLCREHGIPTAAYQRFRDADVREALRRVAAPSDRGEGRRSCARQRRDHRRDAGRSRDSAIDSMFGGAFGEAGNEVVVEEFLRRRRSELLRAHRRRACPAACERAGSQARLRRR